MCRALDVDRVTLVGTEACRRAHNIAHLAQAIHARFAWHLDVISPQQEATLSYRAAVRDFVHTDDASPVVIDPGGGSTEFIVQSETGESLQMASLLIGSVILTETFLKHDPPTSAEIQALQTHVTALLHTHLAEFPKQRPLIALAGTATSLAAIDLTLDSYDGARVQGHPVSRARLNALTDQLCRLPLAQRQTLTGLHPDRAPVLPAGALALACIMSFFDCDGYLTSDRGLRYGLLSEPNIEN